VRRINDEPFDVSSVPGSRAVTIKFIIPNSRMGTVIGKGGSKIKEIQEASGARLNASEAMLPGSTERVLSVSGVADAIHIAVYYIGNILIEYQDRPSAPGSSRDTYRQAGGRDSYGGDRGERREPRAPGVDISGPGVQTQQIFIPNDLVGSSESLPSPFPVRLPLLHLKLTMHPFRFLRIAVIGKAGAKINEIRSASATQIRIMEPGQPGASTNTDERLVTITGQPTGINMAIQLLYQRLEQEKAARLQNA
jgi:heterogeneous nuclear rnp K-like protein 2